MTKKTFTVTISSETDDVDPYSVLDHMRDWYLDQAAWSGLDVEISFEEQE